MPNNPKYRHTLMRPEDRDLLGEISKRTGVSRIDLLGKAVRALARLHKVPDNPPTQGS